MLRQGKTQKEIAEAIEKDKSVISREISRNKDQRSGKYDYRLAQRKSEARKEGKPHMIKFTSEIKEYVIERLKDKLSPEQISGAAKLKEIDCVSHETIYQFIWRDKKQQGTLYTHLRNKGKRYRKRGGKKDARGIIENRVDIDQRPKIVEMKKRFGDWEVDTIIGKNHKGAMVTMVDRASGIIKIKKVDSKESTKVTHALISTLMPYRDKLHTITSDNGKEFAGHQVVTQNLGVDFFFAKPYHSWERGANENANRLIRQYFPKKTDFASISEGRIRMVENDLNNRPRKRFSFKTPIDIFEKLNQVAFVA
jgi:IS30 family transposase